MGPLWQYLIVFAALRDQVPPQQGQVGNWELYHEHVTVPVLPLGTRCHGKPQKGNPEDITAGNQTGVQTDCLCSELEDILCGRVGSL